MHRRTIGHCRSIHMVLGLLLVIFFAVVHAEAEEAPLVTRDPTAVTFPRSYWAPELRANLLVTEFLKTDWEARLKLDPPPGTAAEIIEEIRQLHALAAQRGDRHEEIKFQNEQNFIVVFFPVVMMHQWSHPRTYELMSFAYGLGQFVVLPFKDRFNRARPSQLAPGLNPIIQVPGHPAYPSGHGFQSWLIALLLAELRPDARTILLETANRIGVNREIAGVHYPSDTRAGQNLAEQAFQLAKQGQRLQASLTEAKDEWRR